MLGHAKGTWASRLYTLAYPVFATQTHCFYNPGHKSWHVFFASLLGKFWVSMYYVEWCKTEYPRSCTLELHDAWNLGLLNPSSDPNIADVPQGPHLDTRTLQLSIYIRGVSRVVRVAVACARTLHRWGYVCACLRDVWGGVKGIIVYTKGLVFYCTGTVAVR